MPEDRIINTQNAGTVITTEIKVNDVALPATYMVETIIINHEVNKISTARLVLIDGSASEEKFEVSNAETLVPGNKIEISAGYQSTNSSIFKGIIVKHSIKVRSNGSSLLILECKHPSIKMTIGRSSNYFTDIKDSAAIEEIARKYTGMNTTVQATDVQHSHLVQYDSTDWDFMISRLDVNNRVCISESTDLKIVRPEIASTVALSLVFGATILDLDLEIDARLQYKNISTENWNSDTQEIEEKEAQNPNLTTAGNITADSLANITSPHKLDLKHGGEFTQPEMQAWSKSLWEKHQLGKVRGKVTYKGNSQVKTGDTIELTGVGNRFAGKYYVSGILHQISAGDWQSTAQLGLNPLWFSEQYNISSKPAAGLLPHINGLQIGIVTQLKADKANEKNRIKVHLPIIQKANEGIWTRVATLDAGSERGSFFLPEIGDEVLVGFINDDPRNAVILGMLNSNEKVAPIEATDENHIKGFVTRSKIKMLFDDENKKFSLETPVGKKLTLDDEGDIIKMEDEKGNKLLMDENGISIESNGEIKIKGAKDVNIEGVNVSNKASAKFSANGSGSAEVKSSGNLVINGSMVQIN
ncbi:MAG: type VI secretion system tip protein VgrG [Flavobacteriales bacterium]|nr:type VI secretion system tip protein VgrG [Flavobacteriales bacterium]